MRNEGGGFAEILRLRSQLFWHSLSHIRRFSPLRMTKCAAPPRPTYRTCENSFSNHQGAARLGGEPFPPNPLLIPFLTTFPIFPLDGGAS